MQNIKVKIKYKIIRNPSSLKIKLSNFSSLFHSKFLKEFIVITNNTLLKKLPLLLERISFLLNNYDWTVNVNINHQSDPYNKFGFEIILSSLDKTVSNIIIKASNDNNQGIISTKIKDSNSLNIYTEYLNILNKDNTIFEYSYITTNNEPLHKSFKNIDSAMKIFIDEAQSKNLVPDNGASDVNKIIFIISNDIKWRACYGIFNAIMVNSKTVKDHIFYLGRTGLGKTNFLKNALENIGKPKVYYSLDSISPKIFLTSLMNESIVNDEYINEITDDNVFEILETIKMLNY